MNKMTDCALKGQGLHIAQGIALWYYMTNDILFALKGQKH